MRSHFAFHLGNRSWTHQLLLTRTMTSLKPILSAGFDGGNGELIDSEVMADGIFEARLNMGKEVSLRVSRHRSVPSKPSALLHCICFTALSLTLLQIR